MKNKKGLSTIVATLMIILLTIIAFAIIATVITRNIKKDVGKMDLSSQCLDIKMQVTKVTKDSTDSQRLSITIEREAGGGKIDGYTLSIANSTTNSLINRPGNFGALKKATPIISTIIINPTSFSIAPYLADSTGVRYDCPASQEFKI